MARSLVNTQPTYMQTQIAGEDLAADVMKVEHRNSFGQISTATTTTVLSGSGVLHSIVITDSVASAITVYDNTAGSGTVIALFAASTLEGTFLFDVAVGTGITVVTVGASDITVTYRAD